MAKGKGPLAAAPVRAKVAAPAKGRGPLSTPAPAKAATRETPEAELARLQGQIGNSKFNQKKVQNRINTLQERGVGGGTGPNGTTENPYPPLTPDQAAPINQMEAADKGLSQMATNTMLPRVQDAYSQPFDWSKAPALPNAPQYRQLGDRPNTPNWGSVPQMGQMTDFSRAPGLNMTDVNALPQAAGTGDFNAWRQGQIDATYNDFTRRMDPQFKQQAEDFEQEMANRGIPVGSKLYNQQKQLMQQSQNDARSSALVQAQGIAGQNASQFAGIQNQGVTLGMQKGQMGYDQSMGARGLYGQEGQQAFNQGQQLHSTGMQDQLTQFQTGNQAYDYRKGDLQDQYNADTQARSNWIADQMQQRNMPLNELNGVNAAMSPMAMQNLGYSQNRQTQEDEQAQQRWLLKNTPRGGGGGGGGSLPLYAQYGFSSPMELDAYKMSQAQKQQMWEWQNNPQYRTNKGANPYGVIGATAAGSILGGILGA